MLIATVFLCLTIGLLVTEAWILSRSVNRLQLRIHVNGTRGKSSVTEYIAAGIGNAQPSVMAKITGIIPTIILNGQRQIIKRTGVARVQEQINVIRLAASKDVRSLVMECMSLSPELQRLESNFFKPHIYVITNIKDDHREEMGKSLEEQAESICGAIPENCTVVTNEKLFLSKIKDTAAKRNCKVAVAEELNDKIIDSLPNGIFSDNVALAITACKVAGVDAKVSEEGIIDYVINIKSPLIPLSHEGKELLFLNAFAVNDVESTTYFIDYWQKIIGRKLNITLLFNTRADRPLRSDLFAKWIANFSQLNQVIITGDHSSRAKSSLLKAGLTNEKIQIWNNRLLNNFKINLFSSVDENSLVIGIGNISGDGLLMLNQLL